MEQHKIRQHISEGLRKLRRERGLTQAELAKLLDLSQAYLSKIEKGAGSITAEQLIQILQKYSLSVGYFLPEEKESTYDEDPFLQNALAHLGASHLRVISNVLVPARLAFPEEAILETLIAPSARFITALAPVIVRHCETLNFHRIAERLSPHGIQNRIGWVIDATHDAVGGRLKEPYLPREPHRLYRQAFLLLERKKLDAGAAFNPLKEDELDRGLVSEKTVRLVKENRDKLARHWRIVTRIKKSDFEQALKDSEEK